MVVIIIVGASPKESCGDEQLAAHCYTVVNDGCPLWALYGCAHLWSDVGGGDLA
jgi:hypothetical protein